MKQDINKLYYIHGLSKGYNFPKLFTIRINFNKFINNVRKISLFNRRTDRQVDK